MTPPIHRCEDARPPQPGVLTVAPPGAPPQAAGPRLSKPNRARRLPSTLGQAGNIDTNGDVIDSAQQDRLRGAIGEHIASDCSPSEQLDTVLLLLAVSV